GIGEEKLQHFDTSQLDPTRVPAIFRRPFPQGETTGETMIIGCPKEVKTREYRVGLVPGGVATLTGRGHQVLMEKGAGLGSGIADAAYEAVGAKMVDKATEVWSRADMIVKVKAPIASEYGMMKEGQTADS